jgi:histidine triad (HIT) family protein
MTKTCPFCNIINGTTKTTIHRNWGDTIAITPLNPVTSGHTLLIPHPHIQNFTESPHIAALTMNRAAEYANTINGDINLITSKGPTATQTINHLHIHLIPRSQNDGLHLPWTNQPENT